MQRILIKTACAFDAVVFCRVMGMAFCLLSSGDPLHVFNSDDSVLIAYAITPEMEEQFGSDSAGVSVFWDAWKTNRLSHAHLSPERETVGAAKAVRDEFDAQMLVYAAYGAKGVYFLFDIIDDDFPGRLSRHATWMYDVVDVMFDPHPPEILIEHPVSCLCDTTGAMEISASMLQIQYACGAKEADTTVQVNYFDDKYGRCNFRHLTHRFTLREVSKKMGITVRMVRAGSGRRLQEWLVPYGRFGSPGFSEKPIRGTRVALVINYNDVDTCDLLKQNIVKKFTWGGARQSLRSERRMGRSSIRTSSFCCDGDEVQKATCLSTGCQKLGACNPSHGMESMECLRNASDAGYYQGKR